MIFVNVVSRLWNSPTFTSWVNYAAQALRLIVLLPLVLKSFSDVEVVSWLLFGTIAFFANTIAGQLGFAFSRMVSLAAGGSRDLSPVRGRVDVDIAEVGIEWGLMRRLYGVLGLLNSGWAALGSIMTAAIGYFSLEKVLHGTSGADDIWLAFFVFVLGQFILQHFRRYSIVLRGLNAVSRVNRWQALFSGISCLVGAVVLLAGFGIVALACVMQVIPILNVIIMRGILYRTVEPRFRQFSVWGADSQIIAWLWQPFWKGLVQSLANRGSGKVAVIVFSRYANAEVLAGVLLTLRLLETIDGLSIAPFGSHVPRFGRLLGSGEHSAFSVGVMNALRQSQWVLVLLIVGAGCAVSPTLSLLSIDANFPSQSIYFAMACGFAAVCTIRQTLMISAIGNHIVAVPQMLIAAGVSVLLSLIVIPLFPLWGFIAASYIPTVVFVNIQPFFAGARLMEVMPQKLALSAFALPWMFLLLFAVFSFLS